jgi:predicted ATP-dependent endonuclease of OLD family
MYHVDGNVLVVGENRVDKSNLLQALQLILDPTVQDFRLTKSSGKILTSFSWPR